MNLKLFKKVLSKPRFKMNLKPRLLKIILSIIGGYLGLYLILGFNNFQKYNLIPFKEYVLSFFQIIDVARMHWIYLVISIIVVYLIISYFQKRKV